MAKSKKAGHPLAAVRAQLVDRLRALSTGSRDDIGHGDLSGDACDQAFGVSEADMAALLAEHGSREAAMLAAAIARIDGGRYGVCDGCAGRIPPGRLVALPHSAMCVPCQELVESGEMEMPSGPWAIPDGRADDDGPPPAGIAKTAR